LFLLRSLHVQLSKYVWTVIKVIRYALTLQTLNRCVDRIEFIEITRFFTFLRLTSKSLNEILNITVFIQCHVGNRSLLGIKNHVLLCVVESVNVSIAYSSFYHKANHLSICVLENFVAALAQISFKLNIVSTLILNNDMIILISRRF
jgi:hypothetical protein